MTKFECLYSPNPCLMDLGCPLLRGSSARRLRRCAATVEASFITRTIDLHVVYIQHTALDLFACHQPINNHKHHRFLPEETIIFMAVNVYHLSCFQIKRQKNFYCAKHQSKILCHFIGCTNTFNYRILILYFSSQPTVSLHKAKTTEKD